MPPASASASASACKMLGQMLKSWNFSLSVFFSFNLTLLIISIKPLSTKAYDRRASGDCDNSGVYTNLAQPSLYLIKVHGSLDTRC